MAAVLAESPVGVAPSASAASTTPSWPPSAANPPTAAPLWPPRPATCSPPNTPNAAGPRSWSSTKPMRVFKAELGQALADPHRLPGDELFKAIDYSDGSDERFLRRLWRDLYGGKPVTGDQLAKAQELPIPADLLEEDEAGCEAAAPRRWVRAREISGSDRAGAAPLVRCASSQTCASGRAGLGSSPAGSAGSPREVGGGIWPRQRLLPCPLSGVVVSRSVCGSAGWEANRRDGGSRGLATHPSSPIWLPRALTLPQVSGPS
jgi:hypothetical protein